MFKNHNKNSLITSKRKDISASLLGFLFSICITQIVITSKGISLETRDILLILSTFLIAFRFYIGNRIFISDEMYSNTPSVIWIYDLMVIIIQSALFIALAMQCTIESNISPEYGFYQIYISILILDVAWIFSQYLLDKLFTTWERDRIPVKWAFANSGYVIVTLMIFVISKEPYGLWALVALFFINVVGFILDVIHFDYAEIGEINEEGL